MIFATLLLILHWKVNVFYLLETTASNICQLKLAVMKAKRLTAGSTNSLQQLLRFFSVPPLCVFAMNNQEQFARLFGNTCCSQWSWLALQIRRGYHAICYLFSHHLNSKNNFVFLYFLRLNIKTLKLFPVVCCNEWQRLCHWHRMKLGQVFFFCLQKYIKKKWLVVPDKVWVWYLRHLTLQE